MDGSTQTDPTPRQPEKGVQTDDTGTPPVAAGPLLTASLPHNSGKPSGSKENPWSIEDDLDLNHGAVSEDELGDGEAAELPQTLEDDSFFFGTVFEKVDEFDHHLNDENPWHPDLTKSLFPSQIIGFRWMLSRHGKGGGLIGDKVGCGKVRPTPSAQANDRPTKPSITFSLSRSPQRRIPPQSNAIFVSSWYTMLRLSSLG
jgi:hypothetical protein